MYVDIFNTMKTTWKEKPELKPVIYFRILNKQIMYIGETRNMYGLRPWRYDMDIGEYDYVITIPACKNEKRRRYWEAYCIVKFKPLHNRNVKQYYTSINKSYSKEKINLHFKKKFPEFKKLNIDGMIKKEMQRKIYALENLVSATKQIENLKKERSEYENNSIRTTRNWKDSYSFK